MSASGLHTTKRQSNNIMKRLNRVLAAAGVAVLMGLGTANGWAQDQGQGQGRQGRGNFNPEEFRQRMMDGYREQLEVKSDDEWKVVSERINKVLEARREVGFGGRGMGGFGFGRAGRGGGEANTAPAGGNEQGARRGGPGGFRPEPSPEAEALQKAIESKASADELKAKLAKLREARKEKEANLEKAQEDLRKVLSVRQEASAVLAGLLK